MLVAGRAIAPVQANTAGLYSPQVLERGRQLAAVGNCVACHTAEGGLPNAGGRPMATPFGTSGLKYFFGSALATEDGGNASSTAVRALLRQFVAAENPAKPLSDGALSDMLAEQGIQVARRTVAKYREALKIAPASLRKLI